MKSHERILQEALAQPLPNGTSHNKGLFKYYLSPDMGIKRSTDTSSLITYNNVEIMMSLNVPEILYNYYNSTEQEELLSTSSVVENDRIIFTGTYMDAHDVSRNFEYHEIAFGNDRAILIDNGLITLLTLVNDAQKEITVRGMMTIMRSAKIDEQMVVDRFSNKELVQYNSIHEGFFEQEVPESGSLIDLYNQLHPDDKIE